MDWLKVNWLKLQLSPTRRERAWLIGCIISAYFALKLLIKMLKLTT